MKNLLLMSVSLGYLKSLSKKQFTMPSIDEYPAFIADVASLAVSISPIPLTESLERATTFMDEYFSSALKARTAACGAKKINPHTTHRENDEYIAHAVLVCMQARSAWRGEHVMNGSMESFFEESAGLPQGLKAKEYKAYLAKDVRLQKQKLLKFLT